MAKAKKGLVSKAVSIAQSVAKMDGWKNILTGLNVRGRDRRTFNILEWETMQEPDADNFFAGSDVARKIVEEVVYEAFREGYELQADSITADDLDACLAEGERLKVDEKFQEAWRLARQYGGSGIIPIPRDVKLLAQPYTPTALDKIETLLVLSRWELPRQTIEVDIRSPNFAHPKTYRICPRTGADQMNFEVHHSWILRFDGAYLSRILFFKNNLWHDSILNVCKDPIRNYESALSAVSSTLDDFSVGVMKLKDLSKAISEDRDDLISKRLEIANMSKSVAKMIILDAEAEDFQYQDRQLSGVADCVRLVAGRLVVCSNMPHTKILGESPEGSQATGNSTTKDWYDHVGSQQENYVDWRLMKLWGWILSCKKSPTNGVVPIDLKAVYKPLWQEPESAQSKSRFEQAQADASYIALGVLDPSEVAISRFGTGEYSTKTILADDRKEEKATAPKPGANPQNPDKPLKPGAGKDPKAPSDPNPTKPFKPNEEANRKMGKSLTEV